MTEYEYDENGLLLRAVTVSEPRWTEQDRAEVLALNYFRKSFCPCGCGAKAEDTLVPETMDRQFRVIRETCIARMALIDAQDEANKSNSPYGQARVFSVEKIRR